MKKLLLYVVLVFAIWGCKQHKLVDTHKNETIPGQYIVIMKDAFDEPVIKTRKNDPDRKKQKADNDVERIKKVNKLKNYLNSKLGIPPGKQKKIFVDISIGAVLEKITADDSIKLAKDPAVLDLIPDITIQINPIQQTDPAISINPIQQWRSPEIPKTNINSIQQNDSIQNRYDIDTVKLTTKAILAAGGGVPGAGKATAIWFLDTGIDTDNLNLRIDASLGDYFIGTSTNDDNGHGTFCAGAAAGTPVGTAGFDLIHIGVSEGATVIPVKVLDYDGKGNWGTVIAGLNHVAQFSEPGDIVNLSLGSYEPGNTNCHYPGLRHAIERITTNGVFVTLSAGNDAGNAACNRPGCLDGTNIFTASSINADSTCAFYANFGSPVDYVTVGTRVFSLWKDGNFIMASGTSVSSAILAGIIHAKESMPDRVGTVTCSAKPYFIARW